MGYHREIESSVHLRIYYFGKKQFILLSLFFLLLIIISILSGIFGPSVLARANFYASEMTPPHVDFDGRSFIITSKPVLLYQRELWLSAQFHRNASSPGITLAMDMLVSIHGEMIETEPTSPHSTNISLANLQLKTRLVGGYSASFELVCLNRTCHEVLIAHLVVLDLDVYNFNVTFSTRRDDLPTTSIPSSVHDKTAASLSSLHLVDIEFIMQTYNTGFVFFELFLRFICVLAIFSMLIVFLLLMRRFSVRDWAFEQRWLACLFPFLLFFYNPLHPLIFLTRSWVPRMLDLFFQVNFITVLLLFWLSIYHGIRITSRRFFKFYLPKMFIVFLFWLCVCGFLAWKMVQDYSNPLFNVEWNNAAVITTFVVLGTVAFIYLLYFFVLFIRTYSELSSLPYFDVRLRFLTVYLISVIIGCLLLLALRLSNRFLPANIRGITTQLERREAFSPITGRHPAYLTDSTVVSTVFWSAVEPCFIAGLMMGYFFVMLVGYLPSKNASKENNFKYHPIISKRYDSDEDVIYGDSDGEAVPLNSLKFRIN